MSEPIVESPAVTIRRAADKLRKLAEAATPGPWRSHDTHLGQYGHTATVLSGERNSTELRAWLPSMSHEPWNERRNVWADADYIAAMHPGIGLALVDVLEQAAEALEGQLVTGDEPALRVAREILGEATDV